MTTKTDTLKATISRIEWEIAILSKYTGEDARYAIDVLKAAIKLIQKPVDPLEKAVLATCKKEMELCNSRSRALISGIKEYRALTNSSLKEAKVYVENLQYYKDLYVSKNKEESI